MKPIAMYRVGTGDFLGEAPQEIITDQFVLGEPVGWNGEMVVCRPGGGDSGAKTPPPLYSMTEVFEAGSRALDWAVEEMLPMESITLLAGDPKVGKTTLFLSWLKVMQEGNTDWCGRAVLPSVCWLFTDEGTRTLRRAFEKMDMPVEPNEFQHRVAFVSQNDFGWLELCEWITDQVLEAQAGAKLASDEGYDPPPTPRVILIDTFGAWGQIENMNDYAKTMEKMDPVNAAPGQNGLRGGTGSPQPQDSALCPRRPDTVCVGFPSPHGSGRPHTGNQTPQ